MKEYYYRCLDAIIDFIVPKGTRNLILNNRGHPVKNSIDTKKFKGRYEYIVCENLLGNMDDIQKELTKIHLWSKPETRLVVLYYNRIWEPILKLATLLGWRQKLREQNWLDTQDTMNLLQLAGWEVISERKWIFVPVDIPGLSTFINKWVAPLPWVNNFCLVTGVVARPAKKTIRDFTVSIVVPARNEKGNITKLISQCPVLGKKTELIFVEGYSRDGTWEEIQKQVKMHKSKVKIKAYRQKGIGKADAVRMGFNRATGEMLIIWDADMTVDAQDLRKFYDVLAKNQGEFANGSRLVYPMERLAMRNLNIIGNKLFSWLFTWILGQRFKDTLCGTKAIMAVNYQKIVKGRKFFGDFDPFGDFDLIFGAVKQNLKVVEIPVRYRERTYGKTNISRFTHGWLLLKMTTLAFRRFGVF